MDKIISDVDRLFNNMNADMGIITNILTQPQNAIPGLWSMVEGIFNCILPIGYSLLTLFFMLDLFDKTITFRVAKIENIIKILIRVIIAKFIMDKSFDILNLIYQSISDIISMVYTSPGTIQKVVDVEALRIQLQGMNFIDKIIFQLRFIPINLVMLFLKVFIPVICYGRIIEIYMYTALAPLPLSTMPSEEYRNVSKRFIQNYISVCLQGVVVLISTMSFPAIVSSIVITAGDKYMEFGMFGIITASVVFLYTLSQSKNWARQIVGVN